LNKDNVADDYTFSYCTQQPQERNLYSKITTDYTMVGLKKIWNQAASEKKGNRKFGRRLIRDLNSVNRGLGKLRIEIDHHIKECKEMQVEKEVD